MGSGEHLAAAQAFSTAGLSTGAWPEALSMLAARTGSRIGELVGVADKGLAFCVSPLPTEAYREHDEAGGYSPHVNPRIAAAAQAAPMQVVGDREYDELRPSMRSAALMDFARKWDILHGCQTTLLVEPGLIVGLSVMRTKKEGRIDAEGTAAFAALAPHALSAVRTRLALGERSIGEIASGLEYAGVAAFFCDARGTVEAMTGPAEHLTAEGRLLTLRRRQLAAPTPGDDARLRRALSDALASIVLTGGTRSLVLGPDGGRRTVHVRALPATDLGLAFQPRLLVIVRDGPRSPAPDVLRLAYGFTAAEAEIALALASGQPREAIAICRRVTIGSLRQQIKTILAKADVSREAELVLAVLRLG